MLCEPTVVVVQGAKPHLTVRSSCVCTWVHEAGKVDLFCKSSDAPDMLYGTGIVLGHCCYGISSRRVPLPGLRRSWDTNSIRAELKNEKSYKNWILRAYYYHFFWIVYDDDCSCSRYKRIKHVSVLLNEGVV